MAKVLIILQTKVPIPAKLTKFNHNTPIINSFNPSIKGPQYHNCCDAPEGCPLI